MRASVHVCIASDIEAFHCMLTAKLLLPCVLVHFVYVLCVYPYVCMFARILAQQTEDGLLKVLGVVTGSDLMVGDVLLDINGEPVRGHPKEAVAAKLQGRAGTHVIVHVLREGCQAPISLKLVRHFKARRSATRAPRSGPHTPSNGSTGSGGSGSSPRSPGAARAGYDFPPSGSMLRYGTPHGAPPSAWPPLSPHSGAGRVSPPLSGGRSNGFGGGMGRAASPLTLAVQPGVTAAGSGSSMNMSQASFDPERSMVSNSSLERTVSPPPRLDQGSFVRGNQLAQASFASNASYDPERLAFNAISSQSSYDPERGLITAQTSYDPERSSMTSNTSYDPERQSVYSKSNNPEKSFDPERSHHSFASEASFDPERSTWGGAGISATNSMKVAEAEFSIDPEASMLSLPSPRGGSPSSSVSSDFKRSGKHLDHIAAMLRQAIKGDTPEGSLGQQSMDSDKEDDSRVCSTVMSFDPERGSGGSSREKSFGVSEKSFDPEASQMMSKLSVKSFDPEASANGLLAGPSYDPSVDFHGRGGVRSEASEEVDPEREAPSMSRERSFDPDLEPFPEKEHLPVHTGAAQMRTQRAAMPVSQQEVPAGYVQVSPPVGKARASICASLSLEGGKFLITNVWDDAQSLASIGDQVVKVDGLHLVEALKSQLNSDFM